jgi:hypothetical protein
VRDVDGDDGATHEAVGGVESVLNAWRVGYPEFAPGLIIQSSVKLKPVNVVCSFISAVDRRGLVPHPPSVVSDEISWSQ